MKQTLNAKNPLFIAWVVLVLFVIIALVTVFSYARDEKNRAILVWQDNLGLITSGRHEAVEWWLDEQFKVLDQLANNEALQFYVVQIDEAEGDDQTRSEAGYLKELLTITGHRTGFIRDSAMDDLKVNQGRRSSAGIALFDARGKPIVATAGLPALDERTNAAIQRVIQNRQKGIIDLREAKPSGIRMGFAVPILSSEGTETPRLVGIAVGIKPIAAELYPLLKQKGLTTKTSETYLVRAHGNNVEYISPLADGTPALTRSLKHEPEQLAAAFALASPGEYGRRFDYLGNPVLFSSRALEHTPWVLIHKINAEEALADAARRHRTQVAGLVLLVGFISALLVAAWRHGSSARYQRMAQAMQDKNTELDNQRRLLRSVTDNVTDLIFILEPDMSFRFANDAMSRACELSPDDFKGKSLSAMLGTHVASEIEQGLDNAGNDVFAHYIESLEVCKKTGSFNVSVARLRDGGLLLVMHDVTEVVAAEERRQLMLYQLVQALVDILDDHDPYTADHSRRVSMVSQALAERLDFSSEALDSLRIASALMNIGKIKIPKDVLTKEDTLTDEEFALVRSHTINAVKMLQDVDFSGPVVECIAQSNELLDGSGHPNGLTGDDITLPARILAVANAFVAMTNPRSYREHHKSFQEAVAELTGDSEKKYDRRVVDTLFALVEKSEGMKWEAEWKKQNEHQIVD